MHNHFWFPQIRLITLNIEVIAGSAGGGWGDDDSDGDDVYLADAQCAMTGTVVNGAPTTPLVQTPPAPAIQMQPLPNGTVRITGLSPVTIIILMSEMDVALMMLFQQIRNLENQLNDCYDKAIEQYKKDLEDAGGDKTKQNAAACKFAQYIKDNCDPIDSELNNLRRNLPLARGIPPI